MHTVAEIHGAVVSAVDKLVNPDAYKGAEDSIRALKQLGFDNSENVADHADYKAAHELATYYRHRYPQFKFITDHQLSKVEKKYGLERGELSRFKGAIPERNIHEMINARVMLGDVDGNYGQRFRSHSVEWFVDGASMTGLGGLATATRLTSQEVVRRRRDGRRNRDEAYFEMDVAPSSWSRDIDAAYRDRRMEKMMDDRNRQSMSFVEIAAQWPNTVFISADKELFERPAPELDPIVAIAVKGGFLIITAWGDEAQDPDVANARMN
jgi:hypothetical protein